VVGADLHASRQAEQNNIGYRIAAAGREVAEDAWLALLEDVVLRHLEPRPADRDGELMKKPVVGPGGRGSGPLFWLQWRTRTPHERSRLVRPTGVSGEVSGFAVGGRPVSRQVTSKRAREAEEK
jgi:hypothetical protein